MNKKALPADLLARYLSDECTEEECRVVDEWYQQLDQETIPYLLDEDLLRQKIRARIREEETQKPVISLRRWWMYASGAAASVLLVVGMMYLFDRENVPAYMADRNTTVSWVDYTNTRKKIERYALPDSSVVWLHPGAHIAYPASFGDAGQREVRFVGEGFFDVSRDTLHPFIIYSGQLKTQVLGTSFNVKAYENEPTYQVSVVSGSVAVSTPSASADKDEILVLKPNQQAAFQSQTRSLTLLTINESKARKEAWQPVSLAFDDTPMSEVVTSLESIFSVKISLSNQQIGECRLRVDFNNQRLPEILEMINTLLGTTYEMVGNAIVLSGAGC